MFGVTPVVRRVLQVFGVVRNLRTSRCFYSLVRSQTGAHFRFNDFQFWVSNFLQRCGNGLKLWTQPFQRFPIFLKVVGTVSLLTLISGAQFRCNDFLYKFFERKRNGPVDTHSLVRSTVPTISTILSLVNFFTSFLKSCESGLILWTQPVDTVDAHIRCTVPFQRFPILSFEWLILNTASYQYQVHSSTSNAYRISGWSGSEIIIRLTCMLYLTRYELQCCTAHTYS